MATVNSTQCSPATVLAIELAAKHQQDMRRARESVPKMCGWCVNGFTICGILCRTCGGRGWR